MNKPPALKHLWKKKSVKVKYSTILKDNLSYQ